MLTRRRFLLGTSLGLGSLVIPRIVRAQAVPDSLLVRPPGSIPQGMPQLDPNDPINVGLSLLVMPAVAPVDFSGHGHAPRNYSGVSFAPTPLGNGVGFAGTTNSYLSLGTLANFGSPVNLTLAVWFIASALNSATFSRVVTFPQDDTGTDNPLVTIALKSGANASNASTGPGPASDFVPFTAVLNALTLAVVEVNGGTINLTVNDVVMGSTAASVAQPSSPLGYIGRYNSNYNQNLTGVVPYLGFWKRQLTLGEKTRIFQERTPGLIFPSDRVPLWGVAGTPSFINRPLVQPIFTLPGG